MKTADFWCLSGFVCARRVMGVGQVVAGRLNVPSTNIMPSLSQFFVTNLIDWDILTAIFY